jgi:exosortase E/protease (VPEID-CTERM system)
MPLADVARAERGLCVRVGAAGLVLAAEYLALAVRLDGSSVEHNQGDWSWVKNSGMTVSIAVAVFSAGLIRKRAMLVDALRRVAAELEPVEPFWCVLHALVFGAFAACSIAVFAPGGLSDAYARIKVASWMLLGVATAASLLRAAFATSWWPIVRALGRVGWAGLLLGVLAYRAGLWTQQYWPWFAQRTLELAAFFVSLTTSEIYVRPSENVIGSRGVEVMIAQGCSGIEGLGFVLVLVGGYLHASRRRLKLARAIWLLPLSVAVVWVLNAVRVALLVVIAARVSPAIAFGGFHSKAGWIAVSAVALGSVWLGERSAFFARTREHELAAENPTAAYCLPLLALLAVGLLTAIFSSEIDWLYGLRLVPAAAALFWHRRSYPRLFTRPLLEPILLGAVVFASWLLLVPAGHTKAPQALLAAAPTVQHAWLAARVLGFVLMAPLCEELAFRGFLQRRLLSAEFELVPQARFGWLSLVVSALAFGALHENLLAGTLAGALYSAAGYRRGRLSDCLTAHATTNLLLALTALGFGRWDLLA